MFYITLNIEDINNSSGGGGQDSGDGAAQKKSSHSEDTGETEEAQKRLKADDTISQSNSKLQETWKYF